MGQIAVPIMSSLHVTNRLVTTLAALAPPSPVTRIVVATKTPAESTRNPTITHIWGDFFLSTRLFPTPQSTYDSKPNLPDPMGRTKYCRSVDFGSEVIWPNFGASPQRWGVLRHTSPPIAVIIHGMALIGPLAPRKAVQPDTRTSA